MDEKKVREAIDFIKTLITASNGNDRLYTAIEALEKQLPEKVRLKQQRFSQACKCPDCGKTMIFKDETSYFCGARHKFCPDCGQRLVWPEE